MLNQISFRANTLSYEKHGVGKNPILLFHGFGQDHTAFQSWIEVLKNSHTIYAFDLFFHGKSQWVEREGLEKNDWKEIIELLLQKERIETFEIAGFSLGGKFAMATLEAFPDKVKRVILLAPDGIKTSFWYSLATYPIAVRAIFKSMILHPDRLYRITKLFMKLGLVDKGLLRFAESQMDTPEKRRRVYFSWVYFRHLKFDLDRVANLVNTNHIPFTMVAGKHDKVIVAEEMNRILSKLTDCQFEILETGHNGIIDESTSFLWSQD